MSSREPHYSAEYWTPENICAQCGHARECHLDQPYKKGEPPVSDRGWCVLPEGSCIFSPCDCKQFVEPEDAPNYRSNDITLAWED